jgi:hypothetical protein
MHGFISFYSDLELTKRNPSAEDVCRQGVTASCVLNTINSKIETFKFKNIVYCKAITHMVGIEGKQRETTVGCKAVFHA